jgi:mono/diheme cytochrome c family protein
MRAPASTSLPLPGLSGLFNAALVALVVWTAFSGVFMLAKAHKAASGPSARTSAREGAASAVSFNRDIQPIFNASCAICHQGVGPAGLTLEPGVSYAALVGRKSTESKLPRVTPGSPEASYLFHKISGTQLSVGGSGIRMPRTGEVLRQTQLALIGQWIREGAPDN